MFNNSLHRKRQHTTILTTKQKTTEAESPFNYYDHTHAHTHTKRKLSTSIHLIIINSIGIFSCHLGRLLLKLFVRWVTRMASWFGRFEATWCLWMKDDWSVDLRWMKASKQEKHPKGTCTCLIQLRNNIKNISGRWSFHSKLDYAITSASVKGYI